MNGLLALHLPSSRYLFGRAYTPRLGLPPESNSFEDDAAGAIEIGDAKQPAAPAAPPAAAKPAAPNGSGGADDALELMSLAMVIAGLYPVAQSAVGADDHTPTAAAAAAASSADGGVDLTNALQSFDTADNLIRFHRHAPSDVLLVVCCQPALGADTATTLAKCVFDAFVTQFGDQLVQMAAAAMATAVTATAAAAATQQQRGVKFGAFDKTLRTVLYPAFSTELVLAVLAHASVATAAGSSSGAGGGFDELKRQVSGFGPDGAHTPPWFYACYSRGLPPPPPPSATSASGAAAVMDADPAAIELAVLPGGDAGAVPLFQPGRAAAPPSRAAAASSSGSSAVAPPPPLAAPTRKHPYRLESVAAAGRSSGSSGGGAFAAGLDAAGQPYVAVVANFVTPPPAASPSAAGVAAANAAAGAFPPDFTYVSQTALPRLMSVVHTGARVLHNGCNDTVRSMELGIRLPKAQSFVVAGSADSVLPCAFDYRLFVVVRGNLVAAFPIRGGSGTSGMHQRVSSWLAALHAPMTRLHAWYAFVDSITPM